jgi:hypothetical protein
MNSNATVMLRQVIERNKLPFEVSIVDFREILARAASRTELAGSQKYTFHKSMLWMAESVEDTHSMHIQEAFFRLCHEFTLRVLQDFWQSSKPDLLVSLIPRLNSAVRESFSNAFPGRPFVTFLTDECDLPPCDRVESESQYLICSTQRAVEYSRKLGYREQNIFETSGMILHPCFYEPELEDRAHKRVELGLDPKLATGIVQFGEQGSWKMREILRGLDGSGVKLQLILICGQNEQLREALRREKTQIRKSVPGTMTRVSHYMALADFYVGSAEPENISQALAKRLPVILDCSTGVTSRDRYCAIWARENEVGRGVQRCREITGAVADFLRPGELTRLRDRTISLQNRAAVEIPQIFEKVLSNSLRPNVVSRGLRD